MQLQLAFKTCISFVPDKIDSTVENFDKGT